MGLEGPDWSLVKKSLLSQAPPCILLLLGSALSVRSQQTVASPLVVMFALCTVCCFWLPLSSLNVFSHLSSVVFSNYSFLSCLFYSCLSLFCSSLSFDPITAFQEGTFVSHLGVSRLQQWCPWVGDSQLSISSSALPCPPNLCQDFLWWLPTPHVPSPRSLAFVFPSSLPCL